ncbi:hypothetical protein N7G274_002325 [Stereocaulon virgatum]|uniref:tetrahydrofolate synthase n=1 Tax=Stereocaulon virgatum TaxID=373712 RepID=A0ABR4AKS2_9LECA
MLVSVHAFIREGVNAAVFETHNGGEYDATNAIDKSVISGITSIGMDHVQQLGPTIENIAWHKAGILRKDAPAFSVPQRPEVVEVLNRRAKERGADLEYVSEVDPALPLNAPALRPEVQKMNASLALALSNGFLKSKLPDDYSGLTSHDVAKGVEQFFWLGRYQQVFDGKCQWFFDGAHNDLSVQKAAEWFADVATEMQSTTCIQRILIFSQISDRDGASLLKIIAKTLQERGILIHHLILTTYHERLDGNDPPDNRCSNDLGKTFTVELQKNYVEAWRSVYSESYTAFKPSIEGALNLAQAIGAKSGGMQTLVTGSLHLVGGALRLLDPKPK